MTRRFSFPLLSVAFGTLELTPPSVGRVHAPALRCACKEEPASCSICLEPNV